MSRAESDVVARWIAATVQHHLITSPASGWTCPELPEQVTAVEAHPVGELDTGVAMTTADQVRYFLVPVAEFDHR